jgi:hypothetical protein
VFFSIYVQCRPQSSISCAEVASQVSSMGSQSPSALLMSLVAEVILHLEHPS